MIIKNRYIRVIPPIVKGFKDEFPITPILRYCGKFAVRFSECGFTSQLSMGETVLPHGALGPKCRFNSKGRFIIHKDLPKETAQRPHYWTYYQFHGQERVRVEESKIINYLRYPRTFIPPPSFRLSVAQTTSGEKIIEAPSFPRNKVDDLIHSINLLLEIGGECELLGGDGEPIIRSPEVSLDWEVLRKGHIPFDELIHNINTALPKEGSKSRNRILARIGFIESLKPDFHARGNAGYSGYVVFGFSGLNLFVCESIELNNATYIFDRNWEEFTQLTKSDVICGDLAEARIFHLENWQEKMLTLINRK